MFYKASQLEKIHQIRRLASVLIYMFHILIYLTLALWLLAISFSCSKIFNFSSAYTWHLRKFHIWMDPYLLNMKCQQHIKKCLYLLLLAQCTSLLLLDRTIIPCIMHIKEQLNLLFLIYKINYCFSYIQGTYHTSLPSL